jgi:hypothetical protein
MTTQHTPGPWVVDRSHPDWVEGTTIWANDVVVAHAVADQHHQTEENARLIAAAPCLLAALQELVEYFGPMPNVDNGLDERLTNARAAIDNATGESI